MVKKNISADDYFRDILATIGKEYAYYVSDMRTIYLPVESLDVEDVKNRGFVLIDKEIPNRGIFPHYIIKEISVSFKTDTENLESDKEHLISTFGDKAACYRVIEEGKLNND